MEDFDLFKLNNIEYPENKILSLSLDVDRINTIIKLGIILKDMNFGQIIEKSIFEYSIIYIKNMNLDDDMFYSIYNYKSNNLISSIKKYKNLVKYIKNQNINPMYIAFMNPDELLPEVWKELLDKQHKKEEKDNNIPTTDVYTCYKCGKRKCIVKVIQTRSIDEAPITVAKCCYCYNTFTI